jgi:hypothetical protein
MRSTPPPRMYLLLARRAPVGVVFRRGPSRYVELVRWDVERDEFVRGHWFHGRIYERRCDLSPDGELLVYFASKFTKRTINSDYTYAWTAVSKPPWLTALALWPKGDCWHGGGLFRARRRLMLNHRPDQATPHPKHRPTQLEVEPNPEARGENDPLYTERLRRDGWAELQPWQREWREGTKYGGYVTLAPGILARSHGALRYRVLLERRIEGYTYREAFRLEGPGGEVPLPAGSLAWLDWDHRGRLVALQEGRVLVAEVRPSGLGDWRTLIDLGGDVPESRATPPQATVW